ncbi:hypothetical protein [Streptomyces griseoaurantiacus]|uniref:hypothetical protein n=1 Tax=Streptomyces griseoaurantiacus TaxID=68213 RepID=UPI0036C41F84
MSTTPDQVTAEQASSDLAALRQTADLSLVEDFRQAMQFVGKLENELNYDLGHVRESLSNAFGQAIHDRAVH